METVTLVRNELGPLLDRLIMQLELSLIHI